MKETGEGKNYIIFFYIDTDFKELYAEKEIPLFRVQAVSVLCTDESLITWKTGIYNGRLFSLFEWDMIDSSNILSRSHYFGPWNKAKVFLSIEFCRGFIELLGDG